MLNLLNGVIHGSEMFGYGTGKNGNPAVFLFGLQIYLYALIIVTGMCLAILIAGRLFKKRGIDPYDICIYAVVIIPMGVLGARLYVFIFPWAGMAADWSRFFNFQGGGLGIYGGVILGYLAAFATSKIQKQDFRIVADCIMPGLFIAQSIGRWGNFANQEAHGPLIADSALHWFPFGVEIGGNWYYATFFYESMATLLGFIICLLLLRSKKYKLGWLSAFYGIYYGIVRILVESLRTDSLYLWIGQHQTDIKISQLVSVFTICFGLLLLARIYRKQLDTLYDKFFKSKKQQVDKSRWILLALTLVCISIAVFLLVLGGESNFIAAVTLLFVATVCKISIFALTDRLKLFCKNCQSYNKPTNHQLDQTPLLAVKFVYLAVFALLCFAFAILFFVLGISGGIANDIVLAVILFGAYGLTVYYIVAKKLFLYFKKQNFHAVEVEIQCACGQTEITKLSPWLLVLVPFKTYRDFGVEHLKEYVEEKSK